MSDPMTMSNAAREHAKEIANQLEGATCSLISMLRTVSEAPTDAVVAEKETALRAASAKLIQLQVQLEHRDAVISELTEWASAEDCLTIADKPVMVVAQLMRAMVSNRDLRIKQLQDENEALQRVNASFATALNLLERLTNDWPSVDASLDAEACGFLIAHGRAVVRRGIRVYAGPPSPCPPMGMPPLDPNAKIGPCLAPLQPATPGLDAWRRCAQQQLQPINNRVGPGFGKPLDPVALRAQLPVCNQCGDTHTVWITGIERMVMCTACPVPCDKCRKDGNGPYCSTTPCTCDCHKPKDPQ